MSLDFNEVAPWYELRWDDTELTHLTNSESSHFWCQTTGPSFVSPLNGDSPNLVLVLTECLSAALSGHRLHSLPAEMAKLLVVLLLLCALMLVAAQTGCPTIGPDTVGVCGGTFCNTHSDCNGGLCCPSACGGKLCIRQG